MSKVKKYSIWLTISLGIVVILIGSAFFIASKVIQKDSMKEKIHTLISKKVGGDVNYESMNLHFFHWPHVLIRKATISIPDKVDGSFNTIIVYPKILPLIYGNIEVSEIKFRRPDITLYISERSEQDEELEGHKPFSIEKHKERLVEVLGYLNSHWKGLGASIDYGKLIIKKDGENFLDFNNLNAAIEFPNNTLSYRINSNSNISKTINLRGSINSKSYDMNGNVELSRFKPHLLLSYLFPGKDMISESNIGIDLKYKTKELETFQGDLDISNSQLTLKKGDDEFKISSRQIDTDVYMDKDKSVLTINNADFAHPDITASGVHTIDKNANKVNLNLKGTDINVESSRDAILFVAGHDRIVDLIFDIVRGGTVSQISLEASADSLKNLFKGRNFKITGNMTDGKIFVPIGDFDLYDVSGQAVIADGRLEGTNLKAKSGNSQGYNGTFVIGIEGPVGPLGLDLTVDSVPEEIPPIIKKFVDDQGILYELGLISNLKGKASGKLKIGDSKEDPQTSVYVTELDISGDYKRVPEPVNVKGNKFDFSDKSIEFEELDINIGKFTAPQTTGSFHWKEDKFINLNSKDMNVDLGILFPWLSSFTIIKPHLRHIESITGTALLDSAEFKGPVNESQDWTINGSGRIQTVNLNLEGLGSDMTITQAEIESSSEQVSVSNASIDIKGSKVSAGAVLNNYLTDYLKFQMDFNGDVVPEAANLFSEYFSVPEQINFKGPVSITDSTVKVERKNNPGSPTAQNKKGVNKEVGLNMNIFSESIEWLDSESNSQEEQNAVHKADSLKDGTADNDNTTFNGEIKVKSDNFQFKGFNWNTLDTDVSIVEGKVDVKVTQADLCGISTPGLLEVTSPTLQLEFKTFTEQEDLSAAIKCLFDKAGIITGDFNFDGEVVSKGDIVDVMNTLEGELKLTSNGGRVSKYGGLARFFSALNFGEIFRGNTIDYEDEGFPYEFITATADIQDGSLIIKEAAMDGPSLKIVCEGSIDLVKEELDLQVLVIPVMAVDSVIEKIPLIKTVLGKDFVSIPIKVTGNISDPQVAQLSTHTIGAGLLGIIKQTLNIPVTLVKPLDTGKKKEKAETEPSSEELPDGSSNE